MIRALCVAGLAALLIAGCGDDDAKTDDLTKDEFIQKADAACEQASAASDRIDEEVGEAWDARDFDEVADLQRQAADLLGQTADELRALKPPPEDRESLDGLLETVDAAVENSREIANAIAARDQEAALKLAAELAVQGRTAQDLAQAYGFKTCGH